MPRTAIKAALFAIMVLALVGCTEFRRQDLAQEGPPQTSGPAKQERQASQPTPSERCSGVATPESIEGPYYKPNSPERTVLYQEGIPGERIMLTGYVFDSDCNPIPHAWIDFWQADGNGEYDNGGFTLRGHQYTDGSGKYRLETVIPGVYPGRTPHFHVKVRANDDSRVLTTQLYVPGLATNQRDGLFSEGLTISVEVKSDGKNGSFNFVLPAQT
jgi:protocatechuate 3,4-dioxygenase beta subunit